MKIVRVVRGPTHLKFPLPCPACKAAAGYPFAWNDVLTVKCDDCGHEWKVGTH